uniref:Uncharacterized protein n=1 Tax=Molossus molossus TaxID=27622 RepID=A0A7J8I894_MOLMO|nr:hypothetical protein HJG59_010670 [Molossus molossus]
MDLAFLYSVYWNLFNVSMVQTDSHVPPGVGTGDTVQQQAIGRLGTRHCVVNMPMSRRRGVEAKQDLDHNPLPSSHPPTFLVLSLFLPPPLFLFSSPFSSYLPLSHQLPPSFSLVFVLNTLYVLSI